MYESSHLPKFTSLELMDSVSPSVAIFVSPAEKLFRQLGPRDNAPHLSRYLLRARSPTRCSPGRFRVDLGVATNTGIAPCPISVDDNTILIAHAAALQL